MATIHKLPPPRRAGLYDPLVTHATPDDIYRKSADQHPDLIEALRKAGYRRTWRDDLDDLRCELRASPESHALAFIAGAFVALTVVAIFVAGWAS